MKNARKKLKKHLEMPDYIIWVSYKDFDLEFNTSNNAAREINNIANNADDSWHKQRARKSAIVDHSIRSLFHSQSQNQTPIFAQILPKRCFFSQIK